MQTELRQPDQDLAVNMAKLAVVLGDFTQNARSPTNMELPAYERYLHALEEWSSSLPQSLRYFLEDADGAQESKLSNDDEFASVSQQERSQSCNYLILWSCTWRHSTSPQSWL